MTQTWQGRTGCSLIESSVIGLQTICTVVGFLWGTRLPLSGDTVNMESSFGWVGSVRSSVNLVERKKRNQVASEQQYTLHGKTKLT